MLYYVLLTRPAAAAGRSTSWCRRAPRCGTWRRRRRACWATTTSSRAAASSGSRARSWRPTGTPSPWGPDAGPACALDSRGSGDYFAFRSANGHTRGYILLLLDWHVCAFKTRYRIHTVHITVSLRQAALGAPVRRSRDPRTRETSDGVPRFTAGYSLGLDPGDLSGWSHMSHMNKLKSGAVFPKASPNSGTVIGRLPLSRKKSQLRQYAKRSWHERMDRRDFLSQAFANWTRRKHEHVKTASISSREQAALPRRGPGRCCWGACRVSDSRSRKLWIWTGVSSWHSTNQTSHRAVTGTYVYWTMHEWVYVQY